MKITNTLTRVAMLLAILVISFTSSQAQDGYCMVNGTTTGGSGGTVVTVTTQSQLEVYCGRSEKYIIQVSGTIDMSPFGKAVGVSSNKTIIGLGNNATINHGGFSLNGTSNVIIRNLTIKDSYVEGDWDGKTNDYDAIALRESDHVWVDHCSLSHCGDGLIDVTLNSSYVTISYCVLADHNKTLGFGQGTPNELITMHHCKIENCNSRNARVQKANVHAYNNYLSGITDYCFSFQAEGNVLLENTYFENCEDPMTNDGGQLKEVGCVFDGCTGNVQSTGSAGFTVPYAYPLDATANIRSIVNAQAGPQSSIGTAAPTTGAISYDILVAKDGSGNYTTVQAAVDAAPTYSANRTVIYVKNGTYNEVVRVASSRQNLTIIGESETGTIITYANAATKIDPATGSTFGTSNSSTVFIDGTGFYAKNLTFENSAGTNYGPALAVRCTADKSIFQNCRFLGNQDTYLAHSNRAYHLDCYFEGTTDFIFGGGISYFENCQLYGKGGSSITAASTDASVAYGYVFNNCAVTGSGANITDLGRPWRPNASVTFLNTSISNTIRPEGWNNWGNTANEATTRFSEYNNTGSGADMSGRPSWIKRLTATEAASYTMLNVLKANASNPQVTDNWNPVTTINETASSASQSGTSAYAQIEAEDYQSQSGIGTQASSEGTDNVGWIENGDWIMFADIDFGSTGAETFEARVARNAGTIEVRLDGVNGTLVGTLNVTATGGSQVYQTQSTSITGATGIHDVYLVFGGGGGFNLNWIAFTEAKVLVDGCYSIIAKHSGKGLDVASWSTDNGGNIQQYSYGGQANQQWNITSVGDGYYKIENVNSGRALDIQSSSTASGANVQQWGYGSGSANKQFRLEDKGNGYYWLVVRNSNMCLDVAGASTASGANVQQWGCTESDHQKWQLNYLGNLKNAIITGIQNTNTAIVSVYPNPATNRVTVTSSEEITGHVTLRNLAGQKLASIVPEGNRAFIETSGLQSGMYFVTVGSTTTYLVVK